MQSTPKIAAAPAREHRRQRIAHFVRSTRVASQQELQELLAAEGIAVNQATLSRDVRDMGLLKGRDGYEFPAEIPAQAADASLALHQAVHSWLASAIAAENLIVLKTPAGGAAPLALALDHAEWKGVIGTIAGDDTVLVVCKAAADARRVTRRLTELRERRRR